MTNENDFMIDPNSMADAVLAFPEKTKEQKLTERAGSHDIFAKALSNPIDHGTKLYLKFAKNKNCTKALTEALDSIAGSIRRAGGNSNIELAKDYLMIVDEVNKIPSKDVTDLGKGSIKKNISFRFKRNQEQADRGNSAVVHGLLTKMSEFVKKYPALENPDLPNALNDAIERSKKTLKEGSDTHKILG